MITVDELMKVLSVYPGDTIVHISDEMFNKPFRLTKIREVRKHLGKKGPLDESGDVQVPKEGKYDFDNVIHIVVDNWSSNEAYSYVN